MHNATWLRLSVAVLGFVALTTQNFAHAGSGCNEQLVHLTVNLPELTWTNRPLHHARLRVFTPTFFNTAIPQSLILVIPPTGGETPMDRITAHDACLQGNVVTVIPEWERSGWGNDPEETRLELDLHDRQTERGVRLLQKVIDYFDAKNVGIIATSLGSFYGSALHGSDPRVHASTFIVGAGDNPHVVAYSDQSIVKRIRRDREKLGLVAPGRHEAELRKFSQWDTLRLARPNKHSEIYLVIALNDTTVPTVDQLKLWHAWGQPHTLQLSGGHIKVIFEAFFFHRRELIDEVLNRMEDYQLHLP